MKYLVLVSVLLLSGCEHSLLLVKGVRVTTNGNTVVRCMVSSNPGLKPEIRRQADELCSSMQLAYGGNNGRQTTR
jgi:hypothetical protein